MQPICVPLVIGLATPKKISRLLVRMSRCRIGGAHITVNSQPCSVFWRCQFMCSVAGAVLSLSQRWTERYFQPSALRVCHYDLGATVFRSYWDCATEDDTTRDHNRRRDGRVSRRTPAGAERVKRTGHRGPL